MRCNKVQTEHNNLDLKKYGPLWYRVYNAKNKESVLVIMVSSHV